MSAGPVPAPLEARYVRAGRAVQVTLHQPGRAEGSPGRQITGRLLGEMRARGTLHHYRVAGDDGVLYFAPPSWLASQSRLAVVRAGLTVPDSLQPGMSVNALNVLADQRASSPDDHPIAACRLACVPVAPAWAEAEPAPAGQPGPDKLFPSGQHPRLDPHPDRGLLVAIEEFMELERQYLGIYDEGETSYIQDQCERDEAVASIVQAQTPWLELICRTRATTLHGLRARVGCILLEDQELDPAEIAVSGEFQNERLLAALLRDLAPGSAVV